LPPTATIVRPYDEALRDRLLALLAAVGVRASEDDSLAPGCSDDEVVAEVERRGSRVLVIPFRQPANGAERRNGIVLLQRLERETASAGRVPVLLPVTPFGAGAARLLLGESNPDETLSRSTRHRVLMLAEVELEQPAVVSLVRMHLQLHDRRS
jgi:hypothetical protein